MKTRMTGLLRVVTGVVLVLVLGLVLGAEPAKDSPEAKKITVGEARERAQLMHNIYAATLDVMHERFFRRERSVLPARAMEDIFSELQHQSGIKANWISVNTRAMSIDHEPRTEFEKKAAQAIGNGKGAFEVVEDGYYRRAGAIPLGAGCVGCHTNLFAQGNKTPRFAGLVISIPVQEK
jgi:hypothetical protein